MNNRFKFRVWDKDELRFIEWFNPDPHIMVASGDVFCHERTENPDGSFGPDILTNGRWAANKLVLQQFTGFFDKNGKEIYEGDIMAVRPKSDKELYTVVWDESRFSIVDENGIDILTIPYGIIPMTKEEMSEYRVIGNIFENPELIKK